MALKNCMVAQSGGPTAAINASLSGVIRGVYASSVYDTVYGSLNGITGILNNELINLTDLIDEHPENLTRLITTPAMYLGSCRYKLPDYMDDDSPYVFIFNQFETYHIEAFFYIGGNDSIEYRGKALLLRGENWQPRTHHRDPKDDRQRSLRDRSYAGLWLCRQIYCDVPA